jgi:hypothetical protein
MDIVTCSNFQGVLSGNEQRLLEGNTILSDHHYLITVHSVRTCYNRSHFPAGTHNPIGIIYQPFSDYGKQNSSYSVLFSIATYFFTLE